MQNSCSSKKGQTDGGSPGLHCWSGWAAVRGRKGGSQGVQDSVERVDGVYLALAQAAAEHLMGTLAILVTLREG